MKTRDQISITFSSVWLLLVIALFVTYSSTLRAQSDETTITNSSDPTGLTSPSRVIVTRSERDGRTIETRRVEGRSINGGYAPLMETEQETIKQNPNSVTVVTRKFSRDANGNRHLLEVTEEKRSASAGGRETVVRSTSSADLNGSLQVVQREVQETVPTSDGAWQTTSTVTRQTANGFQPVQRSQEIERLKGDVSEKQTTMLAPDVNGNFIPVSRTESTTTKTASGQTKDERTYQDNGFGKLTVVQRDVTAETKDAQGTHSTRQTYSTTVPGATPDPGSLVLVERVSSSQQNAPNGISQSKQQVDTINLGNPTSGLQPTVSVTGVSQPAGKGEAKGQRVVRGSDGNGGFGVVQVTDSHETRIIPDVPTSGEPAPR